MSTYDYNALCDALAVDLNDIPGLRGHGEIPDKVAPPCAVVAIAEDGPAEDFEGDVTVSVHVLVIVSRADSRTAQRKLNTFRSRGNAESVIDKLEASSAADYVAWKGTDAPSKFDIGGIEYIGAEMTFEVAPA